MMNVRVAVSELDGAPIARVELTIYTAEGRVAAGQTNSTGKYTFVSSAESTRRLTARKVGYLSTTRFIDPRGDLNEVRIVLRRTPAVTLDTVRIAQANLSSQERAKLPVIDSSEIASAPGAIIDIFDIVAKLRPDIGYQHRKCPRGDTPIYVNERRALDKLGLGKIKPGDIEEIRYINCFDKSIAASDKPHEARFYVTLKAGILFDQARGSYRLDSTTISRSRQPPTKQGVRRLDVVDAETHTGIPAAIVTELKSGRSARTDVAGQVLLDFAESTTVLVSVRRTGYVPAAVLVQNNIVTRTPVTVTLVRRGPGPLEPSSQMRIGQSNSADTVAKLGVVGFYARFNDATLPSSAFITADQLRSISKWSALERSGLRSVCMEQLFLDGVRIATDSSSQGQTMLDLLVAPDMVSGMETYIGPEVAKAILLSPTIFSDVQQGVKADVNCTTALWTK